MAKTYPDIGTFTSGQILTAATMNDVGTNLDNFRVPASVSVYRSSTLTGYTQNTAITWQAEHYDTDSMWASGSGVTINTTGLYHVSFIGRLQASATMTLVVPQIVRSATNILSGFQMINGGVEVRFALSGIVQLTAADSITASIFISGGSNYSLEGGSTYGEGQARMALTWLAQVS